MAGTNALTYQVVEGWEQLPEGYEHRDVAGVAVDAEDRVFLICRGDHPIMVYDHKGKFLALVGRGPVHLPHPRHHHRPGRQRLLHRRRQPHRAEVHPAGQAADDARHHEQAVRHRLRRQGHHDGLAARPARSTGRRTWRWGPKGDLYVSDGYGNCRVHQFSPSGRAQALVGRARQGPRPVLSCPTASRPPRTGASSSATGRTTASRSSAPTASTSRSGPTPSGRRTSCSTRRAAPTSPSCGGTRARPRSATAPSPSPRYGRVSVFDRDGRRAHPLGHARCRPRPAASRRPTASRWTRAGDIYVAEVTWTFAVSRGLVASGCHTFQKFALTA